MQKNARLKKLVGVFAPNLSTYNKSVKGILDFFPFCIEYYIVISNLFQYGVRNVLHLSV